LSIYFMSFIFLIFPYNSRTPTETRRVIHIYPDNNWYRGRQDLALHGIHGFLSPAPRRPWSGPPELSGLPRRLYVTKYMKQSVEAGSCDRYRGVGVLQDDQGWCDRSGGLRLTPPCSKKSAISSYSLESHAPVRLCPQTPGGVPSAVWSSGSVF